MHNSHVLYFLVIPVHCTMIQKPKFSMVEFPMTFGYNYFILYIVCSDKAHPDTDRILLQFLITELLWYHTVCFFYAVLATVLV